MNFVLVQGNITDKINSGNAVDNATTRR